MRSGPQLRVRHTFVFEFWALPENDMTREEELLQQALTAAREKRELTARDLFLEVVGINPRNETAWLWLTGLLDDLDDCIYACEMALEINPGNSRILPYLSGLREKKQKQLDEQRRAAEKQIEEAVTLAKSSQRETALSLARAAVERIESSPEAWRLIADLSTDMDEQIRALGKLLALTPDDSRSRERADRLRHIRENPRELAAIYEEQGEFDKAIELYQMILMQPRYKKQRREIDGRIIRLKVRRGEKIVYVAPAVSIARLAAGPPLIYVFMLLIHAGINPFADPDLVLWLESLPTLFGGLLIAFASIRSHNRVWFLLFRDVSTAGSPLARASMTVAGWVLVLLPFLHLFASAYLRMIHYFMELAQ
jgi:tetratricopeptide (TPR) repeat protein